MIPSGADYIGGIRVRFWCAICLVGAALLLLAVLPESSPLITWAAVGGGLAGLVLAIDVARRIKRNMTRQQRLLSSYMEQAQADGLTGLANRRAFDLELERRCAQLQRQSLPLCLLLIDVDFFKRFNDKYGHPAGDEMLKAIARVLATVVRDMDLVARFGGEEFAVVLPGARLEGAQVVAERARQSVEAYLVTFQNLTLQATVSVGLAEATEGETPATLLGRADDALYAAKKSGRNRCYYHEDHGCWPVVQRGWEGIKSGDPQDLRAPIRPA